MKTQNTPVIVEYRLNATGEIRKDETATTYVDDDGKPGVFGWSEGNFSCDCNRLLTFLRLGNDPNAEDDHPCGESALSVRLSTPDGTVIYDEFED